MTTFSNGKFSTATSQQLQQQQSAAATSSPTATTPITIHSSAPAKLILFGEHAVVYKKPALATSLDLRTHAFLTQKLRQPPRQLRNQKSLKAFLVRTLERGGGSGSSASNSHAASTSTHTNHELASNYYFTVHVLDTSFCFPSQFILSHFMKHWHHFSLYLNERMERDRACSPASESSPTSPLRGVPPDYDDAESSSQNHTKSTADVQLVQYIDEMLQDIASYQEKYQDSHIDTSYLENPNQKNALICVFYSYFVGIFYWMKQNGYQRRDDDDAPREENNNTAVPTDAAAPAAPKESKAESNSNTNWHTQELNSQTLEESVQSMVFDLDVETELPVGAGLGSSASFCVSVASCFMRWFKEQFHVYSLGFDSSNLADVNNLSYELECIIHGTPSGIDNTVSTYGGMIRMEGKKVTPLKWEHEPLRVVIVNTKVPRNTKELVAGVREKYMHPDTREYMEDLMDSIENITNSFTKMIHEGYSRSKFEKMIQKNHSLLNDMGVGHMQLDRVIIQGRKYKLQGKLTGAGGGGCAFVYVPPTTPEDTVNAFTTELQDTGFWCREVEISSPGVQVTILTAEAREALKLSQSGAVAKSGVASGSQKGTATRGEGVSGINASRVNQMESHASNSIVVKQSTAETNRALWLWGGFTLGVVVTTAVGFLGWKISHKR